MFRDKQRTRREEKDGAGEEHGGNTGCVWLLVCVCGGGERDDRGRNMSGTVRSSGKEVRVREEGGNEKRGKQVNRQEGDRT